MAFTTAQLLAELQNDPTALGYAALVAAGNDGGILGLINARNKANVFRTDVTIRDVIGAIVPADFAAMTTLQLTKLQVMFAGVDTLDANVANTRTIFLGIFTGMAATIAALTAMAQRPGSRAEVLWGVGTLVTQSDVSFALRGTR